MEIRTAKSLVEKREAKDKAAIIAELMWAYQEKSAAAGSGAASYSWGYADALEWVLNLRGNIPSFST